MIKNVLATAAAASALVGVGAPQALAIGDDQGPTSENGNGSEQAYGNAQTRGDWSPQVSLIQGSLNKPCIGLPAKANLGSLVGGIPVSVQDLNVLSSPQNQQCAENSVQTKGDEPLSHLLEDLPILCGIGAANR